MDFKAFDLIRDGLNEELTLRVEAETSDNGTLSYAWYVSENGIVTRSPCSALARRSMVITSSRVTF